MSTHYIDCKVCGMELGSSHEGYEEGVHPECKLFTKARVIVLPEPGFFGSSFFESKTPTEVWDDVKEMREMMIFDLTEPPEKHSVAFTKNSFPKGGMPE